MVATGGVVRVGPGETTLVTTVAVWSPVMRERAIARHGAARERVHIVGPLQLTPYFLDATAGSRAALAARFDFDARRPIVMVATGGVVRLGLDETTLVTLVLEAN